MNLPYEIHEYFHRVDVKFINLSSARAISSLCGTEIRMALLGGAWGGMFYLSIVREALILHFFSLNL